MEEWIGVLCTAGIRRVDGGRWADLGADPGMIFDADITLDKQFHF
jgi:hypothetical protein